MGVSFHKRDRDCEKRGRGERKNWGNKCLSTFNPLLVKDYKDDKGKRMDEKTKTENEYDDSMLVLQRMDEINETIEIKIDERGRSRGVEWSVGDVRLISLVPGRRDGTFPRWARFPLRGKNVCCYRGNASKGDFAYEA